MDLRETLFAAVESGDLERVEEICRAHRAEILAAFPSWQQVPVELREDPMRLQRYANGLITTAWVFREKLGDDTLRALIAGGDDNPLAVWDSQLQIASEEMEALRYADAGKRLERLLDETNALRGTGADQLRPVTLGFLGECMFQQGNADAALPFFELALDACRAIGDANGIVAYLDNLFEVNRYLGRGQEAARYAAELSTLYAMAGREADAKRLLQRSAIAKAGEPKNRVIATL
jgi:tetratricopeptide (TPR) repeat protein